MSRKYQALLVTSIVVLAAVIMLAINQLTGRQSSVEVQPHRNPLAGIQLYSDPDRAIVQLASQLQNEGDTENAKLVTDISSQPSTIWLTGPSADDPTAQRDMDTVARTSAAASSLNVVPVYELYAIPRRDACAGFSSGGFTSNDQYLDWVRQVVGNLKGRAIFSIEADAIAHTINGCFSKDQASQRYTLLRSTTAILRGNPLVVASYLDAGHPEWFNDPSVLVEPLRRSGIANTNGVAVNVSYFESNQRIIPWAQQLTRQLGPNMGAIIDTSRNGNGAQPSSVSGEARWCNPPGRAVGQFPSTQTGQDRIDAYVWIKKIGESDGACFGHPAAGTFEPDAVLELIKNANY